MLLHQKEEMHEIRRKIENLISILQQKYFHGELSIGRCELAYLIAYF